VRLGINLELIDDLDIQTVNQLFIQTQPAHLQKLQHERLETPQRNVVRAKYIRGRLAGSRPSEN
jgi:protein arginine kinase